jgi:hypothetical protein
MREGHGADTAPDAIKDKCRDAVPAVKG